jgi:transposase
MAHHFKPYHPHQQWLFPPALTDWIKEDSLTYQIEDIVNSLDSEGSLKAFYARVKNYGVGNSAYHPKMMLKVLLYSYCIGVTSSRAIATALEGNIHYRYLSGNQQPDFRTIANFRKAHLSAFVDLFKDIFKLCRKAGLARMGKVALDGRRVQGNASTDKNRDLEYIKKEIEKEITEAEAEREEEKHLRNEVKKYLEDAAQIDKTEDDYYGKDKRGDEIPEHLQGRGKRLACLRRIAQELNQASGTEKKQDAKDKAESEPAKFVIPKKKKRGRKPKKDKKDKKPLRNLTDCESRLLKTRKGWIQGYNAQAMADVRTQVIVSCDVTQQENDVRQLGPMIDKCLDQTGKKPSKIIADAGYWSIANAQLEKTRKIDLYIATTKDWKQRKLLRECGAPRGRIPLSADLKERMERKLITNHGKDVYKTRGPSIEAVFGQMVMRRLTRFLHRGLEQVKGEWALWCTTHNLLKLCAELSRQKRALTT